MFAIIRGGQFSGVVEMFDHLLTGEESWAFRRIGHGVTSLFFFYLRLFPTAAFAMGISNLYCPRLFSNLETRKCQAAGLP